MSTGISISSINRIKELAEEKKFKEALEILDTQNLDKSINPQFLRISGEIFRENKRYYDSRRILLKAHQMSPQGNRILYELIQLYLELGYFSKAQKYYEQYMFYATPDDAQKDYVEYIMKKATGEEIKDLAAILIPILERMPEDKWNFEAILLYHKMERKDKALEESRYILENFKESEFVQPVIDYIDDKLDVDRCFYVYPKEEQLEDIEVFGDLLELEEQILEADYLRMYPPEARIMVEAEDKDAMDVVPVKEKKQKKSKKKKKLSKKNDTIEEIAVEAEEETESKGDAESIDKASAEKKDDFVGTQDTETEVSNVIQDESGDKEQAAAETTSDMDSAQNEELRIKEEREVALQKILSKKLDKEQIKESAKQVANAVKEINTSKAKEQVKFVAETVRDNVKKATDVLGEAVGTKQALDNIGHNSIGGVVSEEELIVDGIIESVLEPPKKTVGQVVMNEELDALIPESLEAMSEEEVASIEARIEEEERLELEALEATLKLEEEKKAKKHAKGHKSDALDETVDSITTEEISSSDVEIENNIKHQEEHVDDSGIQKQTSLEDDSSAVEAENLDDEIMDDDSEAKNHEEIIEEVILDGSSYEELKNRYINEFKDTEESPLDSLGFITVVHSDVDAMMKDEIPETADMLSQIIDDKEFYSGETSLGFESAASYQNHGFEVEDYDFDEYKLQQEEEQEQAVESVMENEEEPSPVQVIYAQEDVIAFEDIIPEEISEESTYEEVLEQETVSEENVYEETLVSMESVYEESLEPETVSNENVYEETLVFQEDVYEELLEPETVSNGNVYEETLVFQEDVYEESLEPETVSNENVYEETLVFQEDVYEESLEPETVSNENVYEETLVSKESVYEEWSEPETVSDENIQEETLISEESTYEEILETTADENVQEDTSVAEEVLEENISEETIVQETNVEEDTLDNIYNNRILLRNSILLSTEMNRKLLALKESR